MKRKPGVSQGLALICAAALPTMAIVSLVPNLPQLFAHFGTDGGRSCWRRWRCSRPSACCPTGWTI
jgi:hypothetical protein